MRHFHTRFDWKNLTGNAGLVHLGRFAQKLGLADIPSLTIDITRGPNAKYLVTDDFSSDSALFQTGILAYNLPVWMMQLNDENGFRQEPDTIRMWLIQVRARLQHRGRQWFLKLITDLTQEDISTFHVNLLIMRTFDTLLFITRVIYY